MNNEAPELIFISEASLPQSLKDGVGSFYPNFTGNAEQFNLITYRRVDPPVAPAAVCLLCGHNEVSPSGTCLVAVPICEHAYHGTRLCGCKCRFKSTPAAPADEVDAERQSAAIVTIWRAVKDHDDKLLVRYIKQALLEFRNPTSVPADERDTALARETIEGSINKYGAIYPSTSLVQSVAEAFATIRAEGELPPHKAINFLTVLEHQAHRNHEFHPADCGECAMTEQIASKLREQLGLESARKVEG